jgi:hypothetical protein
MPEPTTLQAAREQAIDTLCRRFADDAISMVELERRLDKARTARTRDELRSLLADLPSRPTVPAPTSGSGAVRGRGTPAGADATRGRSSQRRPAPTGTGVRTSSSVALAILGGARRAGKWAPPSEMLAVAIMGGVELDFRDAVLEPGSVTTINCLAFWGGIDITVPPDVHVDTGGFALLGGFEQQGEAWDEPAADAPTIQINGFALMAGVDVKVKERGQGQSGQRRSLKGSRQRRSQRADEE